MQINFSDFQLSSGHHPGFSLIYRLLNYLFGFNELLFQLPSIVFSSLAVCIFFLVLKELNISNYFFVFGIVLVTLSPTLIIVSTRVKPYAFETFVGSLYLLFIVSNSLHRYKKTIFLISIISLIFSFYTIYVIASYYFIQVFFTKDKNDFIWAIQIAIFSILWFIFYIRFLPPLLNSSNIHPHVYIDWTILEIIKGILDGFYYIFKSFFASIIFTEVDKFKFRIFWLRNFLLSIFFILDTFFYCLH